MAAAGEVIIDSLLCFLKSAQDDFTSEGLLDVAHAFYSHEKIKMSKTTLANILHKDIIWRRDPDKKRKDLRDVIDFMKEVTESKSKYIFVADSHKGMPPVGMEFIAPLLSNLAEEMDKINNILPGIMDIKSEVINTADTVRQLGRDVLDIKGKFSSAVTGMKEAAKDMADDDVNIINNLKSIRRSLAGGRLSMDFDREGDAPETYAEALRSPPVRKEAMINSGSSSRNTFLVMGNDIVTDPLTGAVSKSSNGATYDTNGITAEEEDSRRNTDFSHNRLPRDGGSSTDQRMEQESEKRNESESETDKGRWTYVQKKRKPRNNGQQSPVDRRSGKSTSFRVFGAKKDGVLALKAVKRTADIYLGRVEKTVSADDIENYIQEVFNVKVEKVENIQIRTDQYRAYKVTVDLALRDKLFKPEAWPEGIVVNKFYRRSA